MLRKFTAIILHFPKLSRFQLIVHYFHSTCFFCSLCEGKLNKTFGKADSKASGKRSGRGICRMQDRLQFSSFMFLSVVRRVQTCFKFFQFFSCLSREHLFYFYWKRILFVYLLAFNLNCEPSMDFFVNWKRKKYFLRKKRKEKWMEKL